MKHLQIKRYLKDLKLKEPIEIIYSYIDHNKEVIEIFYNDEIKLNLNILKIALKELKKNNIQISNKSIFKKISDLKIIFDKNKDFLIFEIYF